MLRFTVLQLVFCLALAAADWRPLFSGRNLDGWESLGDGIWTVLDDGTLTGQRDPRANFPDEWPLAKERFQAWRDTQAWLYTTAEFREYDLALDYWTRVSGNSGISLGDSSRARHAITTPADFKRTPSKIGYEIQINNRYPDPQPTGSIYTFVKAATGAQRDDRWNHLEIQVRDAGIRVLLNGKLVAEHPGDPARPKSGPIGLQLHDQFSLIQFRNIRIRELPGSR